MQTKDNLYKAPQRIEVLTFLLNDKIYSVSVADIREVNRLVKCRLVEKAPHRVLGMINFHGKTTPVFNLKSLLSIEPSELDQKAMWLAVENNGSYLCLAVDKVCRFLNMDSQIIDEMPYMANGTDVEHIKYYARVNDNLIPVLNVRGILRIAD